MEDEVDDGHGIGRIEPQDESLTVEDAIKLAENADSEAEFLEAIVKTAQEKKRKSLAVAKCVVCKINDAVTMVQGIPVCVKHIATSMKDLKEAAQSCGTLGAPVGDTISSQMSAKIASVVPPVSGISSESAASGVVVPVVGQADSEAANPTVVVSPELPNQPTYNDNYTRIFNETRLVLEQKDSLVFCEERIAELEQFIENCRIQQRACYHFKDDRLKRASAEEVTKLKEASAAIEKKLKARRPSSTDATAKPKVKKSNAGKSKTQLLTEAFGDMGFSPEEIREKLKAMGLE
jgi:hypothetical protein